MNPSTPSPAFHSNRCGPARIRICNPTLSDYGLYTALFPLHYQGGGDSCGEPAARRQLLPGHLQMQRASRVPGARAAVPQGLTHLPSARTPESQYAQGFQQSRPSTPVPCPGGLACTAFEQGAHGVAALIHCVLAGAADKPAAAGGRHGWDGRVWSDEIGVDDGTGDALCRMSATNQTALRYTSLLSSKTV